MILLRGLRTTAWAAVGLVTVLPIVALPAAALLDRAPDGELRFSFFPIALLAFDPFAWTCARNSLIFAAAVTAFAVVGGVAVGLALSSAPAPSRGAFRIAIGSLLAASPSCLALGWLGLGAIPGAWFGGRVLAAATADHTSLESWSGWPAWLIWLSTTWPAALALVTLTALGVRERIEPAWLDAARLAGAGPWGRWRRITWPMTRPAVARAAAIIFGVALLEPGAPLILGLRRTLAFQIVEASARPEPFPGLAVWTGMAAAFALVVRWALRRWGGPPLVERSADPTGARASARGAATPLALASALVAVVTAIIGWLPVVGVFRMLVEMGSIADNSRVWFVRAALTRALSSPIDRVVVHSILLGLEVGVGILALAWLLRPDAGMRLSPSPASRALGRLTPISPMVQGVGLMALIGLANAAARAAGMAPAGEVVDAWSLMTIAVGLSVGTRLLPGWRTHAQHHPAEARSGLDAALNAGASLRGARRIASVHPGRWGGTLILVIALAVTNLAPALFFAPWMDGRPAAPAMIVLADGPQESRFQAAALACFLIAANLAGLCAARIAPALPPEWDADGH